MGVSEKIIRKPIMLVLLVRGVITGLRDQNLVSRVVYLRNIRSFKKVLDADNQIECEELLQLYFGARFFEFFL